MVFWSLGWGDIPSQKNIYLLFIFFVLGIEDWGLRHLVQVKLVNTLQDELPLTRDGWEFYFIPTSIPLLSVVPGNGLPGGKCGRREFLLNTEPLMQFIKYFKGTNIEGLGV